MLIEIVGSFFCFLGLGWIYSERTAIGVILLIGYWVLVVFEIVILVFFTIITFGIGSLAFFFLPIQNILAGIISGIFLKQTLNAE